jgi:sugar phosphate isomerase/epimerase
MQLGFVSAILGDLNLEQVMHFARDEGFGCVEVMCWPPGRSDRRYAGVVHLDATNLNDDRVVGVRELVQQTGVAISGLGYYPNPLDPDPSHRQAVAEHLKRLIEAAPRVGVNVVNTFLGRNPWQSVDANWPLLREVWPPLVRHAETMGVKLSFENCPMLFSEDEWPGGKNLGGTPALWRRFFEEFPSQRLGVNFDPSHLIWQFIDPARCIRELGPRILHVHAKDTRIDRQRLQERGILGLGWHVAKLPGMGDVDWSAFFAALTDVGFSGAVCIEVEDRAYEGGLPDRLRALRQSKRYLEQWVTK